MKHWLKTFLTLLFPLMAGAQQSNTAPFNVTASFIDKTEDAHLSFVHEANKWLPIFGKLRVVSEYHPLLM